MDYTVEKLENSKVKFNIAVSAEEWEEALKSAYIKTKNKYSLVGFRKGHIPKKVLESTYGKSVFFEDALDILLPKYYGEILDKETELEPAGRPEPNVEDITDDAGIKLSITVTVRPEVTLGAYTGLEIEKEIAAVSDEAVDAEIKLAQDRAARITEAEGGYEAKAGDTVTLYFSGSIDGVKFEGGTASEYELELGSGTFIPGFEEQLIGVKTGEARNVIVKFPEDYGKEDFAGKEAVFETLIHKISLKEMPALDDEFVKDISEFNTMDEYKADIKAKLLAEAEERISRQNDNAIVEKIVSAATVTVPDEMIEEQAEDMAQEFEYRLMYQGMNIDDYFKYTGSDKEGLKAGYMESAEKNVRTRLVLEEIIKTEKMAPSAEAMNAKFEKRAAASGETLDKYKKKLSGRDIDYIANEVLTETLMEYLKAKNTFVTKA
ncbi:MAG: trigger factor [Clostridiaceae bacterium]|jgi:trigger factor|nr:trigger factor [Clostridiaceae bacterium]